MKKAVRILILLCAAVSLAACAKSPSVQEDGSSWDSSWTMVGPLIGVESADNGLTLLDSKDALAASGLYYARWVSGSSSKFVNEDGKTVDVYDAELYMLADDCSDQAEAEKTIQSWLAREKETYSVSPQEEKMISGRKFEIYAYQVKNENNPFIRGIGAFTVYQDQALSIEIWCRSSYTGDESSLLEKFLNQLHYAA